MILTVGNQNKGVAKSLKAKTWVIMKLTIALLLFFTFQANAKGDAQKITIVKNNIHLSEVFRDIEKQTGYLFFYDKALIKNIHPINVSIKDVSLGQALSTCLKGQELTYSIVRNTIVIQPLKKETIQNSFLSLPPPPVVLHGRVINKSGEPLQNASVLISGTKTGTTTDKDGRFSLTAQDDKNIVLEISSVGYQTKKVSVEGQTEINIVLELEVTGLSDVVVVGYGTQKRRNVTGAIASVPMREIRDMPLSNVATGLQGKIPGVVVQQTSGSPGSTPAIKVRGFGSISAGTSPLIVVDGNIVSPAVFSLLNADEIDKIDVLKDASSAAIYGSRGANGVMLVTTKRGVSGKTRINLNVYTGSQQVTKKLDVLNSQQYAAFSKESSNNAYLDNVPGASASDPNSARPASYLRYRYPRGDLYDWFNFDDPAKVAALPDYNFQDLIFQDAPISNFEFSASGGSDKVQYSVNAGYLAQDGIIKRSALDRYTIRANVDIKASSKFTMGFSINPSYKVVQEVNSDGHWASNGIINAALSALPMAPIYDSSGNYSSQTALAAPYNLPGVTNPVANITEYNSQYLQTNILSSAYGEYKFLPNLRYRISGNVNLYQDRRNAYTTSKMPLNQQLPPTAATGSVFSDQGLSWLFNQTLTYNTTFNDVHNLEVLAGMESYKFQYQSSNAAGNTFANDIVQTLNAAGQPTSISSQMTENATVSYFARVGYNYKTKYLLNFSIRRDGSSIFGPDNRYGTFPAISGGWRITEEPFMKNLSFLSELKLRASYGLSGNNAFNNNYPYVGSVGTANYNFNNNLVTGLAISSLGNSKLGWERNQQLDVGVDIGLIQNRILLTVDYYDRITNDLLLSVNVPTLTGFSSAVKNIGKMDNKGFEFGLNTYNMTGAFTWNTSINLSFNRNKVLALGPTGDPILSGSGVGQTNITVIGEPIGSFYGYKQLGVFLNQAELDKFPHDGTTRPGDVKYADINNDGKIDANDRTLIGNNQPDFIYGMTNSFSFKNIDLGISLQGTQGGQILNLSRRFFDNLEGSQNNLSVILNRWHSPEDPGNGIEPRANARVTGNNNAVSSRWVEDGSYLRIQNVSLGYRLPVSVISRLKLQQFRVYVSGQNLYTWSKYLNYNPEVSNYEGPLSGGVDYGSFPLARTIIFGVNVGF